MKRKKNIKGLKLKRVIVDIDMNIWLEDMIYDFGHEAFKGVWYLCKDKEEALICSSVAP